MPSTTLLQRPTIAVSDFRCDAVPGDAPFAEAHRCHSMSYVRKGSFGYQTCGRAYELVAGSVLIGHPGSEFVCHHDHVCGDECLSFFLEPELVEFGELAQASAEGSNNIALDEIGQLFAERFVEVVSGKMAKPVTASGQDRRRAVEAALWIDAH